MHVQPQSLGMVLGTLIAFPVLAPAQELTHFPDWLLQRSREQSRDAQSYRVEHDFVFTDRFKESGITFAQQAVEDSNKHYKAIHYDHGTAIAVADVDGDGLLDVYFVNQLGGNELW